MADDAYSRLTREIDAMPTIEDLILGKKAGPVRNVADVFPGLSALGPLTRVKTGIKTLDEACRGGIPLPRMVVLGGAPGAGKTTLLVQWARVFAQQGKRVFVLAVDESEEGLAFRLAQHVGVDMDALERHDVAALAMADVQIRELGIFVSERGTIEENVEMWKPHRDDIVMADSLQTIRCAKAAGAGSPRELVDANTAALKLVRAKYHCGVFATSEIARGAYRSKAAAQEMNMLAAFKESGGVEYQAEMAMVLLPEEDGSVTVEVVKNRRYRKVNFALKMDSGTALFTEVPICDAVEKELRRDNSMRSRVVEACRMHTVTSASSLQKALRIRRNKAQELRRDLLADGTLVEVDGRLRPGGSQ